MMKLLLLSLPFLYAAASCGGVPDTAARRGVEEGVGDGSVRFLSATEPDSTRLITPEALTRLRRDFARHGNLKADFPSDCPKTLYFTMIRYTVTHTDGTTDTLHQTFYMDKDQTIVYAIKNN